MKESDTETERGVGVQRLDCSQKLIAIEAKCKE